ncbi:MAG: AMP-binding protein [Oscillospiraceae bacterium]|nr:AMP-binding protein [Oscillospiraceae bacterium]
MANSKEITGLDYRIHDMAARIRELREIMGFSQEEMAQKTDTTLEEYKLCEKGRGDLTFAFLHRCALAFSVDVVELIEGATPRLKSHMVTRAGEGQVIDRAHGMVYYNLAASFQNRIAEPLLVTAEYDEKLKDIELTTHAGQECDIVVKGQLLVQIGRYTELLGEGDCIYYDSSTPHGMIAAGGQAAQFYAIVLGGETFKATEKYIIQPDERPERAEGGKKVYSDFVDPVEDENGHLQSVSFHNDNDFNFAFDVVDVLGREQPYKLAMLHIDREKTARRFTFREMKDYSSQAANYFKSLGIKRGDRVMLVLKRHYQFWFAVLGLHKLGAVAIPATNLLQKHDFEYRFNAAGVTALLCTADGDAAHQAELAEPNSPTLRTKIIVGAKREGWHDFDEQFKLFSRRYIREEDAPCGEDPMLMFFTSGTTGNPKMAAHNYKYPLGHFVTAHYWQCVNPDGLHLTISDTGWAKAMWGKLYGQWLCEAAVFVYDFDKFDAADILPMFAEHKITTFCCPPTMYRMMIRDDISKYDLSSVERATIAGEALNPEVFRIFQKLTGLKIMEGFGQSETTVMIGNLVGGEHKLGSMGKPIPNYDVALVDPDGNPVAVGESGEVVIRTDREKPPGLFCGYYLDEEKTNEAWHDGMYHTGDVAWCDEDGFYWYVGRVDDVIKSSGYRIGPFEIESVIMELPYVLECGVSAEPDEIRGQLVKATIVLTKGTVGTEELKKEIQNYVKSNTAPYKYPRKIVFRDELPKTTSGKIIRNKL